MGQSRLSEGVALADSHREDVLDFADLPKVVRPFQDDFVIVFGIAH